LEVVMPGELPEATRAVYGISVAADLVGLGQQTLRLYERKGLIEPARTGGGTRRYSEEDLVRVRRIAELLDAGLNLAGILMVLRLEEANAVLTQELTEARARSHRPRQPRDG
jgi:MerR family transcriptional regulator, heat shock protein HspR